jgi:hypothetical protein
MFRTVGVAAAAGVAVVIAMPYLERLLHRMTAKVKLQYFDIAGLGEPIRYALAIAGVDFEDARFANRDEFLAKKPTLRFGQVPYLEVDGKELFQSCAILRFIGRYFDASLYPADAAMAVQVDAFLDQVPCLYLSIISKIMSLFSSKAPNSFIASSALSTNLLSTFLLAYS